MKADKLVSMANQIGSFFEPMPDRDEAMEGIANHIKRFWDPRMRQDLYAHVDGKQGEGLSPVVLDAVNGHRARLL